MKDDASGQLSSPPGGIAIIGMAGRFPGAADIAAFWRNLRDGVESISRFSDAELEDAFDEATRRDPNFVRARSILEGIEQFDAQFFAMHAREAELTDPQHRVFLECAWQALEDGGYDPSRYDGAIGVFAGASMNTYFLRNVCQDRRAVEIFASNYQVGSYGELLGGLQDFLATRVSYKLDLRGPSVNVQSACSTSLVAVAQACQSLLLYQCDMALAGAVSITLPQRRGYLAQEGAMVSPTGRCRTFDAKADGTVFGSGAGVVLLKRLEDALADGDNIYAVIRGSALNNDGAARAGFTAPSAQGQAEAIAAALAAAEVDPRTIGYVECHGTATPLGDPIEVAGLTKAFRASTDDVGFCALGSVKPNIGHLDVAAGAAGLIKTALALRSAKLPGMLFFESPNPHIAFAGGPFYVNAEWRDWPRGDWPRRAGVSAFGVGGANAHVVLEEAPQIACAASRRPFQVIAVSARSEAALETARQNLAEHIAGHPEQPLADVAFTLQVGRRGFSHRCAIACRDRESAIEALATGRGLVSGKAAAQAPVAFMFPGQGAQYPGMGSDLYRSETEFRASMNRSAEILQPLLGRNLCDLLYGGVPERLSAEELQATEIAQPALFAISYALAQLWRSFGVAPDLMIGHSVGEFVAACLAGVFSHEDALGLVAARGRLMQEMPRGAMLAVRLPEAELAPLLGESGSLAAINGPNLCVAAGPDEAVADLEAKLNASNILSRRLHTSHAFHTPMMEPAAAALLKLVADVRLSEPTLRCISTVTGDWLSAEQATSPSYWADHCRAPVRFGDGLATLFRHAAGTGRAPILIEAGPGVTLSTLVRQGGAAAAGATVIASLPDASRPETDDEVMARSAAQLWCCGIALDWQAVYGGERRRRVPLPTYPFERSRYWIEAPPPLREIGAGAAFAGAPAPISAQPVGNFDKDLASPPAPVKIAEPRSGTAETGGMESLRDRIVALLENLSGEPIAGMSPQTSFLEMGFDSLFLSQVTQQLQREFGVKLTFRQLLAELSTVPALADYLTSKLPPEKAAQLAKPQVAAPAGGLQAVATQAVVAQAVAAQASSPQLQPLQTTFARAGSESQPAGAATLDQVIREQLDVMSRLMAQQLEALRGVGAAQAAIAPAPSPALTALAPIPVAPASSPAPVPAETPALDQGKSRFEIAAAARNFAAESMTARQEEALAALVARFNAKTPGSKRKTELHRAVLADPRAAAGFRQEWKDLVYPIVSERASGSQIWDIDGNAYIDLVNGYGQTAFGHAPDFVVEAVTEQLRKGFAIGPQAALAGEVAAAFAEMTGNERVTFCNTGSEAVMAAMRVARTVTGRSRIVMFTGDYHGQFDEVLVKGVLRSGQARSMAAAAGIPAESVENMVVLPYGAPESLEWIRQNAQDLAAVLVEPVQSRHPDLQPFAFLKELRAITEAAGAALVFDEVVTGFRMHPGGMQAVLGIRADLATYGKVVGGGLPVGILAGKAAFMDALDGGMWRYGDDSYPEVGMTFFAGTFVRHPLVLAAVAAVLKHLKEQGPALQEGLTARAFALVRRLNGFLRRRGLDVRIEMYGSLFFFSLPGRYASLFYPHMLERGIYIQEHYPCFLTTAHSDADIERIAAAFESSIIAMQDAGFLPGGPEPTVEFQLTESQTEIWLAAQLSDEASCAFNESVTLRLRGKLDRAALIRALDDVIARHDALRGSFDLSGARMRIAPTLELALVERDLEGLPSDAAEAAWRDLLAADAAAPFDLVGGPLLRAQLIRRAAEDHALVLTAHHIICDGWSINVIIEELAKLYEAARTGASADLPNPMSFGRYAAEERARQTEQEAATEAFWLPQFSPLPKPLDLPTDRPRPAGKAFNGATLTRVIDPELTQRFRKAASRQGCTLFVALLASFDALLGRLADQDEVVVGIPAAGQSQVEGENLVGHCVNFLPLRGGWSEATTLAEHLAATRQIVLASYEHQSFTLGTLARKLALPPEAGRRPLVEAQFNLECLGDRIRLPDLEIEAHSNPKRFVIFDLFFNITEQDGGLRIDCDYNTDLFDAATVERWIGHYRTLLDAVVRAGAQENFAQPLSRLEILSAQERAWLTSGLNNSAAADLDLRPVSDLIAAQAERTPDAIAAVFDSAALTYRELNARANQLAHHLRGLAAEPGARIGLAAERSLDMLVALLGIMKAGFAYVPLDPRHPTARLRLILENAAVSALVCDDVFTAIAPDLPAVRLQADRAAIDAEAATAPALEDGSAERTCYVIFTSGSTGVPKGVEVSHRSVANLLWSMARRPGFDAKGAIVACTTIAFDIAALELYLPLIVGGRVVIASLDDVRGGFGLLAKIEKHQPTMVQATPSLWRILSEAGFRPRPGLTMLCGGEALPRDLADRLLENGGELWNVYGPTETTIWSSVGKVSPGPGSITIGEPVLNTQLYVLDKGRQLSAIGAIGELYIGGAGLARGYFRRPELDAKAFCDVAVAGEAKERLYRTGDLARRLPNGALEVLGRIDCQIKLRGFRIELEEIESVMRGCAGVADCAVAVDAPPGGTPRLIGYFVAAAGTSSTPPEVAAHAAANLPEYMAPTLWVRLEALPLMLNGKLDRKSLPRQDFEFSLPERVVTPPRTPLEAKLAKIWSDVLQIKSLGVHDNIFSLGADSIHLFRIAARMIDENLGLEARHLMRYPTIAELAEVADQNAAGAGLEVVKAGPSLRSFRRGAARTREQPA